MDLDIDVNENGRFIPKTNGNDTSENPVVFCFRYLTVAEQSEIEFYSTSYQVNRVRINVDYNTIFRKCITSIEGLSNKGKPITNAQEYLALNGPKCPAWLNEMKKEFAEFIQESMKVNEKN